MEPAVRAPLGGRCPHGLYVTETVTVTQVSRLYRFPSFLVLASTAGVAIYIKNCAENAHKRSQLSLVGIIVWDQPNVIYLRYDLLCHFYVL